MHIKKMFTYTHASCRLYSCNTLRNNHLNHFWVQPRILPILKYFSSLVVPIFNLNYSHSACYSSTTYNQHLMRIWLLIQYDAPNLFCKIQSVILSVIDNIISCQCLLSFDFCPLAFPSGCKIALDHIGRIGWNPHKGISWTNPSNGTIVAVFAQIMADLQVQ